MAKKVTMKEKSNDKKPLTFLWVARIYLDRETPENVTFDTKKERDNFVSKHDRCNVVGKVRSDHFFNPDGSHDGYYLYEKDGKFYDHRHNEEF